jgi:lipopolysaccharide export LptBFGC system permease protein LptF
MTVGTFRGEHEQNLPIEPPLEYPEAVGDMTRDQIEKHISPGEKGFGHPGSVTEYWGRYGRSLAPLALTLIAVPVGLMVRKGSRLAGLGMALPALLGYIVLMMSFEGLGRRGRIAPEIAGLAPSAILMLLSTVMLVRVFRR